MVLTYDSWSINRRDASQAEGCVSAETNTERFRISWHTPHIITFTAECTAFSQWLSLFRNICGRLSCGAASIMLRSKATLLTVNLVCVCCSSSVLRKNAFYSLNVGPDVGQNVKILRKFISFFISDSIWWMKTLSGKFSDNQPIESRLLQM